MDTPLLEAWQTLVRRYCGTWNVFALDLFNEPWGASWAEGGVARDWRAAAEAIGSVLLTECPRVVLVVEGVGNADGEEAYFWGENLARAAEAPVVLPLAHKVAYSPHCYGPGVGHQMPYFEEEGFPSNMPQVWAAHFGAVRAAGGTLLVGEWGGLYVDRHGQGRNKAWMDAFATFLLDQRLPSFFWSLNPNAGDT